MDTLLKISVSLLYTYTFFFSLQKISVCPWCVVPQWVVQLADTCYFIKTIWHHVLPLLSWQWTSSASWWERNDSIKGDWLPWECYPFMFVLAKTYCQNVKLSFPWKNGHYHAGLSLTNFSLWHYKINFVVVLLLLFSKFLLWWCTNQWIKNSLYNPKSKISGPC